ERSHALGCRDLLHQEREIPALPHWQRRSHVMRRLLGGSGGGRRALGREREEWHRPRLVARSQDGGGREPEERGRDDRRPDLRGEVPEREHIAVSVLGAVRVTRGESSALVTRRIPGRDPLATNLDQLTVLTGGVLDEDQMKQPRPLEDQEAQRDQ